MTYLNFHGEVLGVLHISPKKDDVRWDCFEGCYISVIGWLNRDYRWMDVNSWQFGFDEAMIGTRERISELITYNWRSKFDMLDRYVGVRMTPHRTNDPQERIALLQRELRQNKPAMSVIDSYWCPWDDGYQIFSRPHFFIVTGMDEEREIFYCTDTFYEKMDQVLSFEQYINGSMPRELPSVHTFDITEPAAPQTEPQEIAAASVREVLRLDVFGQVRCFARAVGAYFDVDCEIKQFANIELAPVIRHVYERKRFIYRYTDCISMIFGDEPGEEVRQLLGELRHVADQWEVVKQMFVKSSKMKNPAPQLQHISTRLLELADREEAVAHGLLALWSTNEAVTL
ncbi:hypothetical protein B5M42_002065 [Paenibacillus athensensis]|nr:BtrH N-terminal domain-containing protein [Paenibacillus athensensis]MCD1257623.1 hypothetical protein [Paenibacillus athensensis]